MYQTAVHRGERKFAPVERVEQPEVSKEEGRAGAPTSSKLFLFSKEVHLNPNGGTEN